MVKLKIIIAGGWCLEIMIEKSQSVISLKLKEDERKIKKPIKRKCSFIVSSLEK